MTNNNSNEFGQLPNVGTKINDIQFYVDENTIIT